MTTVPRQYQGYVTSLAQQLRIPPQVVAAQIQLESGFDPTAGPSSAGAEGIAQFLPSTWQSLGCSGSIWNAQDSFKCYSTYMHKLLTQYHGNVRNALAAYNAGQLPDGSPNPAGYGYADTVLKNANEPSNLDEQTGSGKSGSSAAGSSECLISLGGQTISVAFVHQTLPRTCILPKSTARAIMGTALVALAALVAIPSITLPVYYVLKSSGATGSAGKLLEVSGGLLALIPGAEEIGVPIAAAGKFLGSGPPPATQTRSRRRAAARKSQQGQQTPRRAAAASSPPRPAGGRSGGRTQQGASARRARRTRPAPPTAATQPSSGTGATQPPAGP